MFRKIKYGSEFFSSSLVVPEKRRILILYTGGTIGMVESKDGNVPKKGFLKQQMDKIFATYIPYKLLKSIDDNSISYWNINSDHGISLNVDSDINNDDFFGYYIIEIFIQ